MVDIEKKKIFLSHAYDDRVIAEKLIEKIIVPIFNIEKQRDIFYTSKRELGIRSSLNWRNKIKTNLQDCNIFIALITSNFKQREMCLGELGAAWVQNKKIYSLILPPIKYENFSVIVSELQADILIKKEDIKSFVESMNVDLKDMYNIEMNNNIDLDLFINNFIRSIKQHLRRNSTSPKDTLPINFNEDKIEVLREIEEINESDTKSVSISEKKIIFERSKNEWPHDYSMQEYYISEQINALQQLRKLQNEVKGIPEKTRIIQKAINEWPYDFTMQIYKANEELDSYSRLNKNHL